MIHAIQSQSAEDVRLLYGRVMSKGDGFYLVEGHDGLVQTERAAGCLLAPQTGDTVLISESPPEQGFILTVLKRSREGPAPVSVPHGLTVDAGEGPLSLVGKNILMAGAEEMLMASPLWQMKAAQATAEVGALSLTGGKIEAKIDRIKTVVSALETSADRILQRVGRLYRRVDEFEDTICGRFRLLVKKSMRLRAAQASLDAEKSIDMDAEKIRLG